MRSGLEEGRLLSAYCVPDWHFHHLGMKELKLREADFLWVTKVRTVRTVTFQSPDICSMLYLFLEVLRYNEVEQASLWSLKGKRRKAVGTYSWIPRLGGFAKHTCVVVFSVNSVVWKLKSLEYTVTSGTVWRFHPYLWQQWTELPGVWGFVGSCLLTWRISRIRNIQRYLHIVGRDSDFRGRSLNRARSLQSLSGDLL